MPKKQNIKTYESKCKQPIYKTRSNLVKITRQVVDERGLGSYPKVARHERTGIKHLARAISKNEGNLVIQHPYLPLKIACHSLLANRLAYLFSIGDYEQNDLDLIGKYVNPGMRVLELGGGIGATAAYASVLSRSKVIVVEADSRLSDMIERNVTLNGGSLDFVEGCIAPDKKPGTEVPFYLSSEIWFSSSRKHDKAEKRTFVPVLDFAQLILKCKPDLINVDIEGAEKELFKSIWPYRPLIIMIEIHVPILNEALSAKIIQSILDMGYTLIDFKGWTFIFQRK